MQKDALLWPRGNGGRTLLIKYYREGGKEQKKLRVAELEGWLGTAQVRRLSSLNSLSKSITKHREKQIQHECFPTFPFTIR